MTELNELKDSIQKYYDNVAEVYHIKHGTGLYGCEWGIKKYYLPLIERFIAKNSKILEIGCGTGKYTKILKKHAKQIYAVDISPKMIEVAKRENPDIKFIIGDCETLDEFDDNQFDVVVGFNTFSYYQDKAKALASIYRVLKKGGIFFNLDMNGLCPGYYIMNLIKMNEMENWYKYIKESNLKNLSLLFKQKGFDVIYKNTINWIPNGLPRSIVLILIPINFILSNLPIIKKFAMRIVIVGRKT